MFRHLRTYLPTSGYLLIYLRPIYLFSYYLLIYALIYLHLMAYGHTPFFKRVPIRRKRQFGLGSYLISVISTSNGNNWEF